jgi:hypothetical protein
MKYLGPRRRYRVILAIARLADSAGLRYDAISAQSFGGRLAISPSPGGRWSLYSYAPPVLPFISSVPREWMISV